VLAFFPKSGSIKNLRINVFDFFLASQDGFLDGMRQLVKELGFVVGAHVTRKGDTTFAEITGMEGEYIFGKQSDADGEEPNYKVHCRSFLRNERKKYIPKKKWST